jgi:hypothetical protein
MSATSLNKANKVKNDEFPTPENVMEYGEELMKWKEKELFKGKTLFLPCDDYRWSGFSKWFIPRMKEYGIKKLICRSYEKQGHGKLYINENGKEWVTDTQGQGSFLEPEAEKYRDEADFILTNPPFSIKIEFGKWCGNKPYIIILPQHVLTGRFWYEEWWNGRFYMRRIPHRVYPPVPIAWSSNIPHLIPQLQLSSQTLEEVKTQTKKDGAFKNYDDVDAIEVPAPSLIPDDYTGLMGVPLTAVCYDLKNYTVLQKTHAPKLEGKNVFERIFIQRKNETQNTPLPRSATHTLFD